MSYPGVSWIDPRIEIRASRIHGRGSFAQALIEAGDIATIWGGTVFTVEDVRSGTCRPGTAAAIAEDLVLASPVGAPDELDHFLNHSCDPNLWMTDEITLVARRDVRPGEELTADYAMWEQEEAHVMRWTCNCGSPRCRRVITGQDWRVPDLQVRYRGHFSPFINQRIARLGAERSGRAAPRAGGGDPRWRTGRTSSSG